MTVKLTLRGESVMFAPPSGGDGQIDRGSAELVGHDRLLRGETVRLIAAHRGQTVNP